MLRLQNIPQNTVFTVLHSESRVPDPPTHCTCSPSYLAKASCKWGDDLPPHTGDLHMQGSPCNMPGQVGQASEDGATLHIFSPAHGTSCWYTLLHLPNLHPTPSRQMPSSLNCLKFTHHSLGSWLQGTDIEFKGATPLSSSKPDVSPWEQGPCAQGERIFMVNRWAGGQIGPWQPIAKWCWASPLPQQRLQHKARSSLLTMRLSGLPKQKRRFFFIKESCF